MKNYIDLAPCKESKAIYLKHKKRNEEIAQKFNCSKTEIWPSLPANIPPVDTERIFKNAENSDIPYGETTTIGKSGCAVYAVHQGLRLKRETNVDLAVLAAEIAAKGYYYPGKGTFHCLFDHLDCTRAKTIQRLLNYLSSEKVPVATLLVINSIYFGRDTGKHFVNAVGLTNNGILIDDSENEQRILMGFEQIIKACDTAWLW